jgi:hypothetical protein
MWWRIRTHSLTDAVARAFRSPPDTLTPLGIGPPIVRQWRPCVWVVIRRQTASPHNLTHHNRVIAAIVPPVRRAFHPGQRIIDQRRPAKWARGVRDVVKLAEQISAAIGEVPGNLLLVDGQQRQAQVVGFDNRAIETALLADADQHQWGVQGDRAHRGRCHRMFDPAMKRGGDGDARSEMSHHMTQRIR